MLNEAKGNMYGFITHTWNAIKGKCLHDCSYCYMKRWGNQKPVRLDEKELKTDLGTGNFIFVGSSTDMFAGDVPTQWIDAVINKCLANPGNRYLFQTKNPSYMSHWVLPEGSVICTTIESNIYYDKIMGRSPSPHERMCEFGMSDETNRGYRKFVTIEPIMKFNLKLMSMIKCINPEQVSIGADSGNNNLPEPSKEEVLALITELQKFTRVFLKPNLARIIGPAATCRCGVVAPGSAVAEEENDDAKMSL